MEPCRSPTDWHRQMRGRLIEAGLDLDANSDSVLKLVADEIESRWQPIETAPKDGTRILVWYTHQLRDVYRVSHWANNGWVADPGMWRIEPTRWMPLPPPPRVGAP